MPAFGAGFGRRRNNGERVETPMEGRGGREHFSGGRWRSRVLPGINEFYRLIASTIALPYQGMPL
jgi:hypothetical protein